MNDLGREYALALFEAAYEAGAIDNTRDDLLMLKKIFSEDQSFLEYLSNPGIPKAERMGSLEDVFEGKIDETLLAYLAVMTDGADLAAFDAAAKEFEQMYEDFKKFSYAEITSAVPMTDEQKKRIIARLEKVTGKRIDPVFHIDPKLMGGVTVTTDGMFFDGSVRKNLDNLKEVIS